MKDAGTSGDLGFSERAVRVQASFFCYLGKTTQTCWHASLGLTETQSDFRVWVQHYHRSKRMLLNPIEQFLCPVKSSASTPVWSWDLGGFGCVFCLVFFLLLLFLFSPRSHFSNVFLPSRHQYRALCFQPGWSLPLTCTDKQEEVYIRKSTFSHLSEAFSLYL